MANPTKDQLAAIHERNRTLLVSAAAGAGKTFTLTRRIIETIKGGGNLSQMLIVTFTRAAAAELRERISTALNTAIAEEGYSAHLCRQLLALPTAKISTIDSFCLDLVRANAADLGLSPAFRLSDTAENQLLLASIAKNLVEDCYEGAVEGVSPTAFRSLVESLMTSGGIAKTEEVLLGLYDKTRNFARSYHLIADAAALLAENAKKPPLETPWGAYIKDRTAAKLASFPARLRDIQVRVDADPILCGKKSYPKMICDDIEDVTSVLRALQSGDYTTIKSAFDALKRTRFSGFRATDKQPSSSEYPLAVELSKLHKAQLSELSTLKEKFYLFPADAWEGILTALAERGKLLYRILDELSRRVDAEKRRRGLLSFSDLSRYAFSLLCREDGGKTPLAEELSHDYCYVYVDEYQDVNEVQHRIFEALAPPRGRFMVGDVKQSIYGFRGARPDIFAALRRDFPVYEKEDCENDNAVLSLATNFRSDPAVLNFVNLVFGRHMATGLADLLGYVEKDDCLMPPDDKAPSGDRVTVALFEDKAYRESDDGENAAEANDEETEGEEGEEETDTPKVREEDYVAAEIKRLCGTKLKGDKLLPKDFAILVRTRSAAARFAEALEKVGLKSECSREQSFFQNPEILLVLSLLNTIDNPYRDVYLAGLLLSPLYGFTMNDLIKIRKTTMGESRNTCALYDAVRAYAAANPADEAIHRFLSDLARYRRMAEGCPVHVLLWQLYRESGLLSIAAADPEQGSERRANLLFFYDYARRFEAAAYRGLYNFISYVTQAMKQDQTIEETEAQTVREDTVRIMTMHKSKGLEFSVCFVCDCGHAFNTKDDHDYVLFDEALGLSMRLRDESGYAILKNPVYNVLSSQVDDRTVEESLRLFYVAMTRAVDRLYVTATVKKMPDLMAKVKPMDTPLDKATTYACRTFADLLVSAVGADNSYDFFINGTPFLPTAGVSVPADADAEAPETEEKAAIPPEEEGASSEEGNESPEVGSDSSDGGNEEEDEAYDEVIEKRFSFVYPDAHLSEIAGKYAVSHLHPGALDESEREECELCKDEGEEPPAPERETKPAFLDNEQKPDAAQKGTATHLFMQFCDFARLESDGAKAELTRLEKEKFLSAEDARLVRVKEVEAFLKTPLFAAMKESGARIYRELRFHARFPAAAFVEDEEKKALYAGETVLVQGVMDAVLETASGELWLIDYKTDRLWGVERTNRALAEAKLRARHATQLSYYAAACRDIFGRLPDRVMIYSLALGDTVDLPTTLPEGI